MRKIFLYIYANLICEVIIMAIIFYSIINSRGNKRIVIRLRNIWMVSIKFFWWKQGWDKRTILSTILIIMPFLWQSGWFKYDDRSLD